MKTRFSLNGTILSQVVERGDLVDTYDGDDAVELLRDRLAVQDLSGENKSLLDSFVSWLQEQADTRTLPIAYAWYRMAPHIDFDLQQPTQDDVERLLAAADRGEQERWQEALHVFYREFMEQENGVETSIDLSRG